MIEVNVPNTYAGPGTHRSWLTVGASVARVLVCQTPQFNVVSTVSMCGVTHLDELTVEVSTFTELFDRTTLSVPHGLYGGGWRFELRPMTDPDVINWRAAVLVAELIERWRNDQPASFDDASAKLFEMAGDISRYAVYMTRIKHGEALR